MWDLFVSVPDHCLSFLLRMWNISRTKMNNILFLFIKLYTIILTPCINFL